MGELTIVAVGGKLDSVHGDGVSKVQTVSASDVLSSGAKIINSSALNSAASNSSSSTSKSTSRSSSGGSSTTQKSSTQKSQNTTSPTNVVTTETAAQKTSSDEINNYYLNNYGITQSQYNSLYSEFSSQKDRYTPEYKAWVQEHGSSEDKAKVAKAEAAASKESFDNYLSNKVTTQQNWGTDGTSTWNAVGNSGVDQSYYDAYTESLKYKTTSQGNINAGATISLGNGVTVSKQYQEGYGEYYLDNSGNAYQVDSNLTQAINKASNTYSYSGSLDSGSSSKQTNANMSYSVGDGVTASSNDVSRLTGTTQTQAVGSGGSSATASSSTGSNVGLLGQPQAFLEDMTTSGIQNFSDGDVIGGAAQVVGSVAIQCVAPTDLLGDIDKLTRGEELDGWDIAGGIIDIVGLIPFAGWAVKTVAKAGLKSAKAALKTTEVIAKTTESAGDAAKVFENVGGTIKVTDNMSDGIKTMDKVSDTVGDATKNTFKNTDYYVAKAAKAEETIAKTNSIVKATGTLTTVGTLGLMGAGLASGVVESMNTSYDDGTGTTTETADTNGQKDGIGDGSPSNSFSSVTTSGSGGGSGVYSENFGASESGGGLSDIIEQIAEIAKNYAPYIIVGICILIVIVAFSKGKKNTSKSKGA